MQFQNRNRINFFTPRPSTPRDIGITFMAVRSWNLVQGKEEMTKVVDGTKVRHHGLFYMENAGGYGDEPETPKSAATDDRHQVFSLWKRKGAKRGRAVAQ